MTLMKSPGGIRGIPREPSVTSTALARPEAARSRTKSTLLRSLRGAVPLDGNSSTLTAKSPSTICGRTRRCRAWRPRQRVLWPPLEPYQGARPTPHAHDRVAGQLAPQEIVHLADVLGVDLATAANQAHAAFGKGAGEATQLVVAAQMRTGGGESVGRQAAGASLEIGEVYGPDEIRIVDAEGVAPMVELRKPTRALKRCRSPWHRRREAALPSGLPELRSSRSR